MTQPTEKRNSRIDLWFSCFTGLHHPDVILIDDQFNPPGQGEFTWPFHKRTGCSPFLELALRRVSLSPASSASPTRRDRHEVAIVNANDPGSDHVLKLLIAGRQLPVVALGEQASATLQKLGYQHERVHHPSFIKWFNSMDVDYGLLILTTINSYLNRESTT